MPQKPRFYFQLCLLFVMSLLAGLLAACGEERPATGPLQVITVAKNTTVTVAPTARPTLASSATTTPVVAPLPVSSQAASLVPTATPEPTTTPVPPQPTATPQPLKQGVLLEPMKWEAQTWNNCGPVSAMMALSYFGIDTTQEQCAKALRPNSADKLVRPDELVSFIEKQGLKVALRENGSLDKLRALLSAGVPVITMQWLKEGDDIAHYRTARGYDLPRNLFIFNDSMDNKPKTIVSGDVQDKLWKSFNRRYLAVYNSSQEATVMAVLGDDADPAANLYRAVEAAKKYTVAKPDDLDGWANLGHLTAAADECAESVSIWEQKVKPLLVASESGPFNRFLWYQLWPLECYNKVGKHQEVIQIAPNEITQTKAYAEARYEYAVALAAVGRKDEAITQLKKALLDDPKYDPPHTMLEKLGAG